MEAYDAAVLSYALASAGTKIKPGLLGLAPMLNESFTPPARQENPVENDDNRNYLFQLLRSVEQQIINKSAVQLAQLMEVCATKQTQVSICI